MDPKHRDRVAFVRVCSGRFQPGLQVKHVRTGKPMKLSSAQQFLARERSAIEEAWPGDVIGVMDRGTLRIGDTLAEHAELEFSGIPRFAPEHFARIVAADPLKRKQLDAGLRQLTEEGAAQVFYTSGTDTLEPDTDRRRSRTAAVRRDAPSPRARVRRAVPARAISARYPRWVVGPMDEIERIARDRGRMLLFDAKGHPLLLFEDAWGLRWVLERESSVTFHEVAP